MPPSHPSNRRAPANPDTSSPRPLSLQPRQTNRSIDGVPIRNRVNLNLASAAAPAPERVPSYIRAGARDRQTHSVEAPSEVRKDGSFSGPLSPTPSQTDGQESPGCSPTSSEIDALEESLYDFEVQSTFSAGETLISHGGSRTTAPSVSQWDNKTERAVSPVSLPRANPRPRSSKDAPTEEPRKPFSILDRLRLIWPNIPSGLEKAPFTVQWEATRVALHCDTDLTRADDLEFHKDWRDQQVFWACLKSCPSLRDKRLPNKSDPRAWQHGFDEIYEHGDKALVFTATMHATTSRTGPPLTLELHPLKYEQSSRLFRRFGSDRFLEIRLPSVDSWQSGEAHFETLVARWLVRELHPFMSRHWSAFYVRDRQIKSTEPQSPKKQDPKAVYYDRVLFFAESGAGLLRTSNEAFREPCDRRFMLDWLLHLKNNESEPYLKLFHRVALGLSKTSPVLVLQHDQIRQQPKNIKSDSGEVMNDGAGRISPGLMKKVRDSLGLQTIPTAIQGRFGSAKGMWVVDVADLGHDDWIETFPSQRKWNCDMSSEAHRTLEVRSCSTSLTPASLNIQFLPILEDRSKDAVRMRQVFVDNMVDESEAEIEHVKLAMQHTELFRKWARDGNDQPQQRVLNRAVPFLGGLPESFDNIMSFLVDGGFEPMQLQFLQDLIFQKQKQKGETMKRELRIKIAKSTYAYMLVDFWGVLEPNEIHLSFSSNFDDGTDELSDLDGRDVLVARSPAHLPSDIQKVRATFKPQLRHLRDVVIFSAKGDISLAAKLSGGDYDGDKAWICWDHDIVDNFQNHELPPKPNFQKYLKKDSRTLQDLHCENGDNYVDAMLEKAFAFNLGQKYLGACTAFKEKLCYHRWRISDEKAIQLSWLLSELADQPKQGIIFGQTEWNQFRDDVVGTRRELPIPAYKSKAVILGPGSKHIIDFLTFKAKQVVDGGLGDLNRFMKSTAASSMDRDLFGYWDHFENGLGKVQADRGPYAPWFMSLRDSLQADVEACMVEWSGMMGPNVSDYAGKVKYMYGKWCDISPRLPADEKSNTTTFLSYLLHQKNQVVPELSHWELLKASWAFKRFHTRRFVWQIAGRQLQAIKALATKAGVQAAPVVVAANMYAALKPDNTYIKRLMASEEDDEDGYAVQVEDGPADLENLPWGSSQEK